MSENYMEKACQHCPFRRDVKPFLHPDRAYEIASGASNPYNTFPCHKTTVHDERSDDGGMCETAKSKQCFGFVQMQGNENGEYPDGFKPDYKLIFDDAYEMESACEERGL